MPHDLYNKMIKRHFTIFLLELEDIMKVTVLVISLTQTNVNQE